jgi:hypothetical protein
MKLVTLGTVRKGDWVIKASCLDEQILIFLYNECIMVSGVAIFYCEEQAYYFIEGLDHESRSW